MLTSHKQRLDWETILTAVDQTKAATKKPAQWSKDRQDLEKARERRRRREKERLEFEREPGAAKALRELGRGVEKAIRICKKADKLGNLSPEAGRYVAGRITKLVSSLEKWRKLLDDKYKPE